MKNDPTFKFVAVVILAGLLLAFADIWSSDSVKIPSPTKVVATLNG